MAETRPLRADAARNRALILETARTLFAEKGMGVGLEEIARRAGVGVGTVYRRFPDKEQLIAELFEERMNEVAAGVEEAAAEPDPLTAVRALMTGLHERLAADRTLRELLFASEQDRFPALQARIRPLANVVVRRAQAAGVVRPDVVETDFQLLGLMIGAAADATRAHRPDAWRRYSELMLRGMLVPEAAAQLSTPPLSEDEALLAMRHA